MKTGKRVMNVDPSPDRGFDWSWTRARKPKKPVIYRGVDFRKTMPSWGSRVEDQKDTGSCVGQAGAMVLRYQWIKSGICRPNDRPSIRFLWMASKEMDPFVGYPSTMIEGAGTYIKSVVSIMKKFGCPLSRDLSMSGKLSKLASSSFNEKAKRGRIASYYALTSGSGSRKQSFKFWLSNHGPIITRLNIDEGFVNPSKKESFVLQRYTGAKYGGHAVVIAGYRTRGGKDEYLVKNSYGKRWGNKGYLWVSDDYAKLAFTEAYGVVV
jgi:hypothetical protein